jgi:hypothetical protein
MNTYKRIKRFKQLVFAKTDVHAAKSAAQHLLDNFDLLHRDWAYRAIETGIIISYSRPFGENQNLGSLPNQFRLFDDRDAQIVHDGILRARDIQEAHNNLRTRGSLVRAPFSPEEAVSVSILITPDGRTFWEVRPPPLDLSDVKRMIRLFTIQEHRLRKEIQSVFEALLREHSGGPGDYRLGVDFPAPADP